MRTLTISTQRYRTHKPFRIARGEKTAAEQVIVTVRDGAHAGRGACVPYGRYGETIDEVIAAIETCRPLVEKAHAAPTDIAATLATQVKGAARNALDCALYDLAANQARAPVWTQVGLRPPQPMPTAMTISVDTPATMASQAAQLSNFPLIKLKLGGDDADPARVEAVHQAQPDAKLILDANESLTRARLDRLSETLPWPQIALIEQPLPADRDADLKGYPYRDYLCADESIHGEDDLPQIAAYFGAVNIKLDKAGGIAPAIALARTARKHNLKVMIGCMLGSSLAMAPAFMMNTLADFLDLDGPLLLRDDDASGFTFTGGIMHPAQLWGYGNWDEAV
ncbi:MAG: dipeptide epimerase [Pseudomonadota bacterium]